MLAPVPAQVLAPWPTGSQLQLNERMSNQMGATKWAHAQPMMGAT